MQTCSHVGEVLPLDDVELVNISEQATAVAPQQDIEEVVSVVVPDGEPSVENVHIPVAVIEETGSGQSDVNLTVGRPKRLCSKPKWMADFVS